jgi:3',5'-cyclic AMP phosphodiesterase CpdA
MFRLAHASDLHATPVRLEHVRELMSKRLLGWLSWATKRSRVHRAAVLQAMLEDLEQVDPDHIAVTGDLTNASSEREFAEALHWLEGFGSPQQVSVVPGNHDALVAVPRSRSWDLWASYLGSDSDLQAPFPTLRVRDQVAIVGVCSAVPTAPFLASGSVGGEQLERLEKLLGELADTSLCRVVLIHHPPVAGTVSLRRALRDAEAFRGVLRRTGADLVLHGHGHRSVFQSLEGRDCPIPVVGARSASYLGDDPEKLAQYHVYAIEPSPEAATRFAIRVEVRGFDPAQGRFASQGQGRWLS